MNTLNRTPLYEIHLEHGARMVPFAGYEMPVQYPSGIVKEHRHTRTAAGLFDVSHMGQVSLHGDGAAAALETLVPVDILGLEPTHQRYALFTNDNGGILDDFMVTNAGDRLFAVVNAACKSRDIDHLKAHLDQVEVHEDRALVALQGPRAAEVLGQLCPDAAALVFMQGGAMTVGGVECFVTRSGYTGEDGFEISIPAEASAGLVREILTHDAVEPAGLGARDSLRLEAGLCLYGHDIDDGTTPVEAGLRWALSRARRPGGERAGGYPGAGVIERQLSEGIQRRRVGLAPLGRAPVREGTELLDTGGSAAGTVTSGGFGPTVEHPVAMGYVTAGLTEPGTALTARVRGRDVPVTVRKLPFVRPNYYRGT
ncbi:MAG: glycine cleavage system aminomethyltransferase GcvT [Gammaproteobacteria bacterium]|nr:glycine cleavage system aminomethyltransferase GcvT [Gammaproteobacteria bacterium]